jgi:putative transcriptional regulator
MLGENIKNLRKGKGYSQETLAGQLNVVRQTISKWEKGMSVPDAEVLNHISELFEVPISELLGNNILESESEDKSALNEVAKSLAVLNEQIAISATRRKKRLKRAAIGIGVAIVVIIVAYVCCFWMFRVQPQENTMLTTTNLECTLNGEIYRYVVTYNEQYQIVEAGGNAWITNHVQTEQYGDANFLIAQIEDYFTDRGGTCEVIEEEQ